MHNICLSNNDIIDEEPLVLNDNKQHFDENDINDDVPQLPFSPGNENIRFHDDIRLNENVRFDEHLKRNIISNALFDNRRM